MAKILSIDPFNNDVGPGIRIVIDFSYNDEGFNINHIDLLNEIRRYRHYIEMDNGGVTFKGNIIENIDFLIDLCNLCHKSNIKTCIEIKTSDFNYIKKILYLLDFIVLNIDSNNIYDIVNLLNEKKISFLTK